MIMNGSATPLKERLGVVLGARRYLNVALAILLIFAILRTFSGSGSAISDPSTSMAGVGEFDDDSTDSNSSQMVPSDGPPPELTLEEPDANDSEGKSKEQPSGPLTETIVMGRRRRDEAKTQWVKNLPSNIKPAIYIVDDPGSTSLHLDKNHGREAMVYTKYIIDHWDDLADITFFWHPDDFVWHNNMLLNWNSTTTINRMNRSYILEQGYVPSRCDNWPGCPNWATYHPTKFEHQQAPHYFADMFSPKLMGRLFPNRTDHPNYFAETCCSQFAASREGIHRVGIQVFKNLQAWIKEYWADEHSGRVMEMMWQYLFLEVGRLCPKPQDCYCKTYGLCIEDPEVLQDMEKMEDYRQRFHQMHNLEGFLRKELRTRNKGFEKLGVKYRIDVGADPDVKRLGREWNQVKRTYYKYRDRLRRKFQLKESPTTW